MKTEERIKELEARFQRELAELKKELKPELEVGKWYKTSKDNLLCYTGRNADGVILGYGFIDDDWGNWKWGREMNDKKLATNQEVFEALKKEAIKRGFKRGVTLKATGINEEFYWIDSPISGEYEYLAETDTLDSSNGNGYIYHKGKWAEIIKEEPIMIGGFEVKFDHKGKSSESIIIGCKVISRPHLESLKNLMSLNKFKKVSFDGIETDLETIEKILTL
jgi:hypothetical protein